MAGTQAIRRAVSELRRRKVFRVAAMYAAVAWIVVEIADTVLERLGLPAWSVTLVIVLVAAGFPLACILAWAYDITPRGIERTAPAGEHTALIAREQPTASAAKPQAPTDSASIAVLPFADLSATRDQDYFCDGLAEEISNSLCCVRGLRVASRTSAFQFKGRPADVREIGRALNVRAVLEGSVRKSGDRVRITAQLVDAINGYHLWSESFDRDLGDVFALQSEIAQKLVRALSVSLSQDENEQMQRGGTRDSRALEFYLRGRQLLREHSDMSMRQAAAMFRRAIEHDAAFAQAWAGLADSLSLVAIWRVTPEPCPLDEALEASRRASELEPSMPEAHVARANVLSLMGKHEEAVAAFEAALALNPGHFDALFFYGRHAFAAGETTKAAELFERARSIQPEEYQTLTLLGSVYRKLGEAERALEIDQLASEHLLRRLEMHPDDARALQIGAVLFAGLGERQRAVDMVERAVSLRPREFSALYNAACTYSLLGETDRALEYVERFSLVGRGSADWIRQDPDLDNLRGDARFQSIIARLD